MDLLFFAVLATMAYLAIRKVIGYRTAKEEQQIKSRMAASIGSALPSAFGGQSTANLPEPDTSDRLEPEPSNVYVIAPPARPQTYHPFRETDVARVDEPADEPKPKKRKKKKKSPSPAAEDKGEA